MNVICCDDVKKRKSKKYINPIISKEITKLGNKLKKYPIYSSDDLDTSHFIIDNDDNIRRLRSDVDEIDVTVTAAYIDHNHIRFSTILKYDGKKKSKYLDFMKHYLVVYENIFSYLDNIKIKEDVNFTYIDCYKKIKEE